MRLYPRNRTLVPVSLDVLQPEKRWRALFYHALIEFRLTDLVLDEQVVQVLGLFCGYRSRSVRGTTMGLL